MSKFIIDSFRGGISEAEDYGIRGSFQYGQNLNIRSGRDVLVCNQALVDETPPAGGFTALIDWWVPLPSGNILGFARNGTIYENVTGAFEPGWYLRYTDPDGAILGAWVWSLSNGNTYAFWATATKLHSKLIPGASLWTDVDDDIVVGATTYTYPKTNLTSTDSHMMMGIGGGVGALAICNDETLAIVGYDGSYTNEVLRFTPGNKAVTLLQRDNNLIVGTEAKNQLVKSALFLWDGHDTQEVFGWDDMKPLPIRNINAMIDVEVPLIVAGNGDVYSGDFVTPQPIFSIPSSGVVNTGSVTANEFIALMGAHSNGSKAGVYSYGRDSKNAPLALNLEYALNVTEIGAILKVGDELYISYNNSGSYGVKNIDTSNKATGLYESLELHKPLPPSNIEKPTVWDVVVVRCDALPAGCSITCKYQMDRSGSWLNATLEDGSTSFSTEGGTRAVFFTKTLGDIGELQLTLTPSGNSSPTVRSVEWFFN